MARTALRLSALLLTLILGLGAARAEYPVIDKTAIAKLIDQLNKLQEQINQLTDIANKAQTQINAIGRMGQITIPMINMAKIGRNLNRDMDCLLPDLARLMPKVEFEDLDWNSICEAGDAYRKSLWIDPEEIRDLPWDEQEKTRKEIDERRENLIADATAKGLGQGDIGNKGAADLNDAAGQLEAAADAAQNENTRLAVIAQGQVLIARGLAQQNQILAQLLKVHSAYVLKAGLPPDSVLAGEEEEGSTSGKEGGGS